MAAGGRAVKRVTRGALCAAGVCAAGQIALRLLNRAGLYFIGQAYLSLTLTAGLSIGLAGGLAGCFRRKRVRAASFFALLLICAPVVLWRAFLCFEPQYHTALTSPDGAHRLIVHEVDSWCGTIYLRQGAFFLRPVRTYSVINQPFPFARGTVETVWQDDVVTFFFPGSDPLTIRFDMIESINDQII